MNVHWTTLRGDNSFERIAHDTRARRFIRWGAGIICCLLLIGPLGAEGPLDLAAHHEAWPKQVKVQVAVTLSGESGTTQLPVGSSLDVLGLEGSTVLVGLGNLRGRVALTDTDFRMKAEEQWKSLQAAETEKRRMELIQGAEGRASPVVPNPDKSVAGTPRTSEQREPNFWLEDDDILRSGVLDAVVLRDGASVEEVRAYVGQVYEGLEKIPDLSLVGLYQLAYEKFRVIPPNQIEVLLEAAEEGRFVPYEILDAKLNSNNAEVIWKYVRPGVNVYNYGSCTDRDPWNVNPPNILDLVLSHGLQKNHEQQILRAFEEYCTKGGRESQWLPDARVFGKKRELLSGAAKEAGSRLQEFRDKRWIEAVGRMGLFLNADLLFNLITESKSRDAAFAYAFRSDSPHRKELAKRLLDEEIHCSAASSLSFDQTELISDLAAQGDMDALQVVLEGKLRFHSTVELIPYGIGESGDTSDLGGNSARSVDQKLLFVSLKEYHSRLDTWRAPEKAQFDQDFCLLTNVPYHLEEGVAWSFRPMTNLNNLTASTASEVMAMDEARRWFADNRERLKTQPLSYGAVFYLDEDPEWKRTQAALKGCAAEGRTESEFIANVARTLNEEKPDRRSDPSVPVHAPDGHYLVSPLNANADVPTPDPKLLRLSNANFYQMLSQPPFVSGRQAIALMSQISEPRLGTMHRDNKIANGGFSVCWLPESDFLSYLLGPMTGPEDTQFVAGYLPTSDLFQRADPRRFYPSWRQYMAPTVGLRIRNSPANEVEGTEILMAGAVSRPGVADELKRIFYEGARFDSTRWFRPDVLSADPSFNPVTFYSVMANKEGIDVRKLLADVISGSTFEKKSSELVKEAEKIANADHSVAPDWHCVGWGNQNAYDGLLQVAALNGYESALKMVVDNVTRSDHEQKMIPHQEIYSFVYPNFPSGLSYTCEEYLGAIQKSILANNLNQKLDYRNLPKSVLSGKPPRGFSTGGCIYDMILLEGCAFAFDNKNNKQNVILYGENDHPDLAQAFFGRFREEDFLRLMRQQIAPLAGQMLPRPGDTPGFKEWFLKHVPDLKWDERLSKYRVGNQPDE